MYLKVTCNNNSFEHTKYSVKKIRLYIKACTNGFLCTMAGYGTAKSILGKWKKFNPRK